jgi:hypothetical protein
MFDYELQAEVKSIENLVPKVDGPVQRVLRVTFRRDLDEDIGRSIAGQFGVDAVEALNERTITKIEFPIDAVTAKATLKGTKGEALALGEIFGIKAIGKAKKLQEDKEPDEPQAELKFQFPYSTEAWMFFGENTHVTVGIKLQKAQLDLPGTDKPPKGDAGAEASGEGETKKSARKKRNGGAVKSSHGHDRAEASGEITDPQQASTPEEAERIREQQLRERRMEDEAAWTDGARPS